MADLRKVPEPTAFHLSRAPSRVLHSDRPGPSAVAVGVLRKKDFCMCGSADDDMVDVPLDVQAMTMYNCM